MTGAIIGDLAAWTWLNDHDAFYPRLVSEDAKTSVYSDTIITASDALLSNPEMEREEYERLFRPKNTIERSIDTLMRAIVVGWLYEEDELSDSVQKYSLPEEKEDWYAAHFLAKLICALRNGATKKAAAQVEHCGTFRSFTKDVQWKTGTGTLSMLVRAWMAFYDAFDFTSALHNAMKLPGDKHVNGILVGALAEAMYGCEVMMLKKKYCSEGEAWKHIIIPGATRNLVERMQQYERKVRKFFPKNYAMTNVELHHWASALWPSHVQKDGLSEEAHRRILKAFYTGWDNRNGFYLDDGWVYVYRSCCLISRFQFKEEKGQYSIVNVQKPDEVADVSIAIEEAMYAAMSGWYMFSGEEAPANLQYCKYYRGEPECPASIRGTVKGDLWYGEMMFITNNIDLEEWTKEAQEIKNALSGKKLELANKYPIEQFAIIVYIETLFSKWRPYDDMNWVFEY